MRYVENVFSSSSPKDKTDAFNAVKFSVDKVNFNPLKVKGFSFHECDRRSSLISEQNAKIEEILAGMAWFPYRKFAWRERTRQFVIAYDYVMRLFIAENHSISETDRQIYEAFKFYWRGQALRHPWMYRNTKTKTWDVHRNWPIFVAARRSADMRQMIYEDYVAGALLAVKKRGWGHWLAPSNLVADRLLIPQDKYVDATIPGHVAMKYKTVPKLTNDPYFRADAFAGDPVQIEYLTYLVQELRRVFGGPIGAGDSQRVRGIWTLYQQDGRIPATLSISDVLVLSERLLEERRKQVNADDGSARNGTGSAL